MKVLVLGSGFIADHLPYEKITDYIEIDWQKTRALIAHHRPQVLINCLGKTGRPNVDWCEQNKAITAEANVAIPIMLADLCQKFDIHMIQLGSGCMYFGKSPNYYLERHGDPHYNEDIVERVDAGWKEDDFANPQSFYSKSKYACDLMLNSMPHVTTLRIRMPISEKDSPRNLINKLKGYNRIIDIPNSMTFMSDFTRCVDWIIKNGIKGTYHVTNPETLTAVRIMKEFQKYVPEYQFKIITEQELDNIITAKRSNCILNTDKLTKAGFKMTSSEEALEICMANYIKNIRRNNV
jgi:dTDP-4-dehydrorhamnose reductase